jgi:hypothetical protein
LTVVGGAAPSGDCTTFIGLGLRMLQGYGGRGVARDPVAGDDNDRVVGPALPGVEVKLGANAELLARGNVMQGYWRNPVATRAAIDGEGWLHTGDIADIREGRIYIRGRLKDILVMSNGEKLPPQDVEFALMHDPVFEQVMLVGEGRPFLSLLTVTKETNEQALLERANALLKNFPRWVRIRKVIATQDPWSMTTGCYADPEAQAAAGAGAIQGRSRQSVRKRGRAPARAGQDAGLTLVAGRPTLADVDALRLLAALNPREADDETPCVVWHCPDCGASRRRFPISSHVTAKTPRGFAHGRSRTCS